MEDSVHLQAVYRCGLWAQLHQPLYQLLILCRVTLPLALLGIGCSDVCILEVLGARALLYAMLVGTLAGEAGFGACGVEIVPAGVNSFHL